MDKESVQTLEKLLYRKIMLYSDLVRALERERECLIDVDLDGLWEISGDKEKICAEIKSAREEIMSFTGTAGEGPETYELSRILGLVRGDDRAKCHELHRTLIRLKGEVEVIRKENMLFISDSLSFLDEIISIITGQREPAPSYNDRCQVGKTGSHLLLSREV